MYLCVCLAYLSVYCTIEGSIYLSMYLPYGAAVSSSFLNLLHVSRYTTKQKTSVINYYLERHSLIALNYPFRPTPLQSMGRSSSCVCVCMCVCVYVCVCAKLAWKLP